MKTLDGNFLSKVFLFAKIAIQSTNLSQKAAIKRIFRIFKKVFKKQLTKRVYQAYNTVKEQSVLMH